LLGWSSPLYWTKGFRLGFRRRVLHFYWRVVVSEGGGRVRLRVIDDPVVASTSLRGAVRPLWDYLRRRPNGVSNCSEALLTMPSNGTILVRPMCRVMVHRYQIVLWVHTGGEICSTSATSRGTGKPLDFRAAPQRDSGWSENECPIKFVPKNTLQQPPTTDVELHNTAAL
jgi:hypothetical protein